ncbi:uncharacterized protein BO88DRAFT_353785 [Aspergillus vadensis CBS 113365]|uniref:Uncharacterized protein n=1 Tax=Aspergillus vadensis (strain CBS 113365 / IMI 142717 / IBT 24658) TaxID=1448311 RepID=A0A319AV27_ASPVC|nr:hypothetical protein BO88DRAFT_353785 [Aspergillus vadensis CBS 113365]PYH63221.1 hypothetical protein BO88DRAFT_353785 [Aspergillus vadensis CBS 113365]
MTDEPSKLPAFGLAQRGDQQRPGSGTKSTEKKQEAFHLGQHSAGEISAGAGGLEQ